MSLRKDCEYNSVESNYKLRTLYDMESEGQLTPNKWQRAKRWKLKDEVEWLTKYFKSSIKTHAIILHKVDDYQFEIVDGQNRIQAFVRFFNNFIKLPRSAIFNIPNDNTVICFKDLTFVEQQRLLNIRTYKVELYPPNTAQWFLRELFYSLNRSKAITSQELVYSWRDDVEVVELAIHHQKKYHSILDKINKKYKSREYRFLFVYIRIIAFMIEKDIVLSNNKAVEKWCQQMEEYKICKPEFKRCVAEIIKKTMDFIYDDVFKAGGYCFSIHAIPDIAWYIYNFDRIDDVTKFLNFIQSQPLWTKDVKSKDSNERRKSLLKLFEHVEDEEEEEEEQEEYVVHVVPKRTQQERKRARVDNVSWMNDFNF